MITAKIDRLLGSALSHEQTKTVNLKIFAQRVLVLIAVATTLGLIVLAIWMASIVLTVQIRPVDLLIAVAAAVLGSVVGTRLRPEVVAKWLRPEMHASKTSMLRKWKLRLSRQRQLEIESRWSTETRSLRQVIEEASRSISSGMQVAADLDSVLRRFYGESSLDTTRAQDLSRELLQVFTQIQQRQQSINKFLEEIENRQRLISEAIRDRQRRTS